MLTLNSDKVSFILERNRQRFSWVHRESILRLTLSNDRDQRKFCHMIGFQKHIFQWTKKQCWIWVQWNFWKNNGWPQPKNKTCNFTSISVVVLALKRYSNIALYYFQPQRSCGQGYVFTRVCDSVHGGGVCLSACWDTTTTPGSRHPLPADTPSKEQAPPQQTPPQGADPPPPEQTTPRADTHQADPPGADTVAYGIRSMRGRYASYWNAFLFQDDFAVEIESSNFYNNDRAIEIEIIGGRRRILPYFPWVYFEKSEIDLVQENHLIFENFFVIFFTNFALLFPSITDSNFENNTANGPGGALYYDQSEGTVSSELSFRTFCSSFMIKCGRRK